MHSIFDRKTLQIHRDRTTVQVNKQVSDLCCDILERAAIYRPKFKTVLNIGSKICDLKTLTALQIDHLVTTDLSLKALQAPRYKQTKRAFLSEMSPLISSLVH